MYPFKPQFYYIKVGFKGVCTFLDSDQNYSHCLFWIANDAKSLHVNNDVKSLHVKNDAKSLHVNNDAKSLHVNKED